MDGNGETIISYIKIWFIIHLKQPFINGCLGFQGRPCSLWIMVVTDSSSDFVLTDKKDKKDSCDVHVGSFFVA